MHSLKMSFFDYPLDTKVILNQLESSIVNMNKSAMEALKNQDFEEAGSLLHKSLQILKLSKPSEPCFKLRAVTLNNLGILYRSTKDFQKALQFLSSALEVARNLSTDVINRAGTHLNICAIKSSLNQHEQALQHALTAIQMLSMRKSEVSATLVVAYHSAGIEYQHLSLPLKARAHFEYGFNISAQKLGKNHPLTVSLEEALQDYYGYKARNRQQSTEVYLEKRKPDLLKDFKDSRALPRYVPPIEKIYKQEPNLKNQPSFLSPVKVRKRVFKRQELSTRVRDMVVQNQLRDESLEKFRQENFEEFRKKAETHEEVRPDTDLEGMIHKFREDIIESSFEGSRNEIKRNVKTALVIENCLKDQEKSRESFSSPCKSKFNENLLYAKEDLKDSESKDQDENDEEKEDYQDVSEDEDSLQTPEDVNFDEEKLRVVENTLLNLDKNVQVLEDHKKLLVEPKGNLENDQNLIVSKANREKQSILIQKHVKKWLGRKKFLKIKNCAIRIQKAWREHRYRLYLRRVKNLKSNFSQQLNPSMLVVPPVLSDSEVQTDPPKRPENKIETKAVQMIRPYNRYKSFHRTIVFIQAHIRGFLARLNKRKTLKKIIKIQSNVRMYQIRQIYLDILHAIIFIQRMYRRYREKKKRDKIRLRKYSKPTSKTLKK